MENLAKETSNMVKADEVIGVKVINGYKENLGKISDIVLDKLTGHVKYLVLESGSFLSLGGKLFALPWNAVHYDRSEGAFRVNIAHETLRNAPGFDKENWPELSDPEWGETITSYYSRF